MAKPKLTYFSVRGLIEPIRLLLKDAKVEYEMIELGPFVRGAYNEGLDALRQLKVLDFGAVPLWEEEGLKLVQSASIYRHLARKYGYFGENENEAAKIDSLIEGTRDASEVFRKLFNVPDDKKEEVKKEILEKDVPKWLGFFETFLKNNNNSSFVVGKKISIADLCVYGFVDEAIAAKVSLSSFPLLSSHHSCLSSRPNLSAYVASSTRYPPNVHRYF